MKEPKLPIRVKHCLGLYTRDKSDLFIDDLTSVELRMIANHREWIEKTRNKPESNYKSTWDNTFCGY